jgi:hypothetical protein
MGITIRKGLNRKPMVHQFDAKTAAAAPPPVPKTLTLNVCQGVGDIFWVYQKFAPHVDRIHFRICHLDGGDPKIQNRAVEFLKLLPNVVDVGSMVVPPERYERLAHGRFDMRPILEGWRLGTKLDWDYACNDALESGTRLDEIDPEIPIQETVPIRCDYAPLAFEPGEYVAVYVSGSTKNNDVRKMGAWSVHDWFEFVRGLYARYKLDAPVILIGASYDRAAQDEMEGLLLSVGFRVAKYIDSCPGNVTYLLKNSRLFVGYQSGLNILADNLDVPQVMVYFDFLRNMQYAWCKRANIDNGKYNAALFSQKPYEVLDGLKLVPR